MEGVKGGLRRWRNQKAETAEVQHAVAVLVAVGLR